MPAIVRRSPGSDALNIRTASSDDAAAVLALAIELGYANDLREIRERLTRLATLPEHRVLVADDDGKVLGFCHVRLSHQVESATYAEIAGLIVAEPARGRGTGTRLVEAAEGWARECGVSSIRVRSNVKRVKTHAFYQRRGFEESKAQKTFTRCLLPSR
jgi:N-acetylglutamate synthase-like GNAT family acetyltransferase